MAKLQNPGKKVAAVIAATKAKAGGRKVTVSDKPQAGMPGSGKMAQLKEVVISATPIIKQKVGTERLKAAFDFGGGSTFELKDVIDALPKVAQKFGKGSPQHNFLLDALGQKGEKPTVTSTQYRKPDLMKSEKQNIDTVQNIVRNPITKTGGSVKSQVIDFLKSSGVKPSRDLSKDKSASAKNLGSSLYGKISEKFIK